MVRALLSKQFRSKLDLASEFMALQEDTPSDFVSAYQSLLHIPSESARALWGSRSGREGIRVRSTGEGFGELRVADVEALRVAGFNIPTEASTHGHWIYLNKQSFAAIREKVGKKGWDEFEVYGQYKAALERYGAKGQEYPGLADGLSPVDVQTFIDDVERRNPDWKKQFRNVNEYMDQLLLVSVLSGELSVLKKNAETGEIEMGDALKIKAQWADYWPLPRQVEDRATRGQGGGTDPSAGIKGAHGSALPFRTLTEAVETRTKMALEAYYTNRMMLSIRNFNEELGKFDYA